MPDRPEHFREVKGGTRIAIRTVGPEDAPDLIEGFNRLSQHSRIMRFLRSIGKLSADDIEMFTTPDHSEHEALGAAVVSGDGDRRPAGIAHWFRSTRHPERAEIALTVVDEYQGIGIGSALFEALAALAVHRKITQFDALTHLRNDGMGGLLRKYGATERREDDSRIFRLDLGDDPARWDAGAVSLAA